MAASEAALVNSGVISANKFMLGNKLYLIVGIAAVAAAMTVFWLWSQQPDYRILFSNYTDKDGGAIVAALEQLNVPYKFSEGGNAILVPASQVHQARLKLASQGLPKGGNIGFELLENQKFGVSQFVEQVNFQRALEGELERSIQSIAAVQVARIHLAIPKSSVFVRDQEKPTASVLLNLHPGRSLDPQQVSAIVHLVASSVPELPTSNVTVVDQNGNLLSDPSRSKGNNTLDPSQLKYVDDLQSNIVKRIESIISPIVGANNVHAEASAEVDFSTLEQANESYKPNQAPDAVAIRSMQSNESQSTTSMVAAGVPGALSNQPPAAATAPVTAAAGNPVADNTNKPAVEPSNTQKNVTTNFELDKTVRYLQQPMGGVKRLSVAVVVNNKQEIDKNGKTVNRPLNEAEKTQIKDLAKQAMGFNEARGDTLSIVNSSFVTPEHETLAELPMWKQPENIELAKDILRVIVGIMVLLLLYIKLMKPMLQKLMRPMSASELMALQADQDAIVRLSANQHGSEDRKLPVRGYQENLETAKQLAKENPKMVANVVTSWVSSND